MSDHSDPFIFDESFDSSPLFGGHYGDQFADGLVAKTGALLSMSAYEKPVRPSMIDLHASASLHGPAAFEAYPHASYSPHIMYPAQGSDLHYIPGPAYQTDAGFAGLRPSMADPRIRQAPEITSFTQEGDHGDRAFVYLQSAHDFLAQPPISVSLFFGSKRVDCDLELLGHAQGTPRKYLVSGQVPPFMQTGYHSFAVPLRLVVDNGNGLLAPLPIDVGTFTYACQAPPPSSSHKRKASTDSEDILQPAAKKPSGSRLQIQDQNGDSFVYSHASPYSPYLQTPTNGGMYQPPYNQTASPKQSGHHYTTSTASQVSLTAPSPHTPAWSPAFTTVNNIDRSPVPPMTPIPRPTSTAQASQVVPPTLIRTSTIQQSPGSLSSLHGPAMSSQAFNPYAMYPHKASLKLNGDLDKMVDDWSLEEFDARRRLIEFTRHQTGSTIHADFKAVAPEDRQPNSICISCIWWEEKKECFVTSVDTIYLLESLVAVRFTVEEKNRIRRNLEGFRPLTVSKAKSDSEDFFKVIMGFPNPKPRNIEKDVKVFPWKILSHALKKIISKYSASYSSTASALPTPTASVYASTDGSADHQSPQADYVTTSISSYPMVSTASYPVDSMGHARQAPQPMQDLRLQMPQGMSNYHIMPPDAGFHAISNVPQSHAQLQQAMSAPQNRMHSAWDYSTFINSSPATMAPAAAPASDYARNSVETAEFLTPASYVVPSRVEHDC